MKRLFLLIILTISGIFVAKAQVEYSCTTGMENTDAIPFPSSLSNGTCQPMPNGLWEQYKDMNQYIPDMDATKPLHVPPIKTIRVNINVIQKDDGTGNFEDNEITRERLRTVFSYINDFYSHRAPSDPISWVTELPNHDSRIRFSIGEYGEERIYFYQNTNWWNTSNVSYVQSYISTNYPERLENLNVYVFKQDSYNHASASPYSWNDFSSNQHVKAYYWIPAADWGVSMLLAHEFAHSLGLLHTYNGGGASAICDQSDPEFLKDVFLVSLPDVSNCPHICDNSANPYETNGDRITNNIVGGSKEEVYISPMQAGQMHRALSLTSVRKYVTSEKSETPLVITNEQVWDFDMKLYQDLIIEDGAILKLTCHLVMHPDARIIVKPGGRLIIDGATIGTDLFEKRLWQGIEVWGNKNTHQYAVNGSYGQGYVELKNGATIENAVCALNLWRPDHWSNTGGIVHATDAVFRNNHRSVHALYYKNYYPTNLRETDYNATFNRCQFIVNENYLGDEDHIFHKHVDLSHVRGFKFYACDFSVSAPSSNISYWTSGIAGNEAGFLVKGVCDSYQIPCSNYDQCTFTGFFTAINAVSDGSKSAPAITVRQTSFDNNDFGIYMRKLSNASILFSDFDVKRQDNWLCGAGIFSENMFNFTIEENEFKKNNTFNGNSIGVYIKNSDLKNIIYNNLFMNLYCGNLAIGKNIEGVGSEHLGLEYLCNTNIGNNIDFYVLKEPNVYSGIQINQGSALAAARNTFSENGYHFYNGGDFIVSYYYYNVPGFENERPLYFNSDKFFPIPTDQTSGCPSHYSGTAVDTVVISPERRQQLEQEYYEAYNTYHSLKTIYEQHVDGGNTQNELNDITTATPSDMWALRAQLLNHSPFLSGKVLETSADHPNVLPEPVLFEILISNPDELKKDSLMNYLENKDNPLPQDKINMLRQIANGTTAKTVMQTQMAASKRDFSRAAGEIIRSLVNDTIFNVAEYREWLTNMEDINADHEIIATYVDEGDFTTALALADMLPSLYGLTGTDLAEHQDYKDLLMLYRDWYNDGRNAMQMNNTERAIVEHIADYSTGIPQMMARTLLEESTGESDAENSFACVTLTLPEGGQGRGCTFTSEDIGKAVGMDVSVKPNPATTWTAVDYTLPAKMAQATIRVTNALGVTVMTAELNGNQGQKVLDLRDLADGVYVYTVSCGEYVQTGKLVIAK